MDSDTTAFHLLNFTVVEVTMDENEFFLLESNIHCCQQSFVDPLVTF